MTAAGMQENRFLYARRMHLEGFEDRSWYGGLSFRMLEDVPMQRAFDEFSDRVIDGVSRRFVPVYRMADGEFEFVTGQPGNANGSVIRSLTTPARRLLRTVRFKTCWGETYHFWQRSAGLERLGTSIRRIAETGYLALYFALRADGWGQEHFARVCRWFDANGIELTPRNYVPFYFVYALLSGPRQRELFAERNVLVVTHFTKERQGQIERGLRGIGAKSVQYLPIGARGALFETLDLSRCSERVDIAIVAAGIGSAPILCQLEPLAVPAIDAGMWVDCLVNPARRAERPFLRISSEETR